MKYDSAQLLRVIEFWRNLAVPADLRGRALTAKLDVKTKEVVDIVGPRRSGKSSILKLMIQQLPAQDGFLFINFEDPFFINHAHPQVIEELIGVYEEYYEGKLRHLFLDEIQVIDGWERAIRKLRDAEAFKIYLTGSSSKLLSGEMASLLTGRHLSYELLPLSFVEYLQFKGLGRFDKKDLIVNARSLLKHFSLYLANGGYPEVLLTGNAELLKQYFFDVVQRDIVMRHAVREIGILEQMAVYVLSHAAKTISIESLKKTFKTSYALVTSYLEYLKESFLIFELPQFSYSLKTQAKALKKYYAVDMGLANAVSFRFSEDKGRLLENCIYLQLRRKGRLLYYYKTQRNQEVDFLVRTDQDHKQLIQVAWSLRDDKTRAREVSALQQALGELDMKQGLILTYNESEEVRVGQKRIIVKPVYQWLLED